MAQAEDPFALDLLDMAAAAAPGAVGGGGGEKAGPGVDVTRHNFDLMLPLVRRYLAACDFFSFDCEMTGLFLEGQNENYLDDMQDRYTRTAAAAHSFVITQFGLSCFKRQDGAAPGDQKRYLAATFNFYLFPRPPEGGASQAASATSRRFVCDAGSLAFLASQGFDFNRCIYDGVPFMPVRQRDELLRQIDRDNGGGGNGEAKADVVLSKPEDQEFVQGLLTTVREWLASGSLEPLDLPPVNRYLRLLSYQALARPESFGGPAGGAPGWHPGFYVKKTTDERNWTFLRLVRCISAAEAAALEAAELSVRRAQVAAAAGFGAVWEAMRDCGRPAVGHNCMFDVAYGIAQFGEGRLPATWEGFKVAVATWYRGGLYDTKHLCRQLPELLGSDTTLGVMYGALLQPQGGSAAPLSLVPASPLLPAPVVVAHARGFEKYVAVAAGQLAHEAGYDAFMTGSVFAALEAVMEGRAAAEPAAEPAEAKQDLAAPYSSVQPYIWRLNVTRSDLPYALLRPAVRGDPASIEPVPERPLVFYLGSLSYGVRANDIHRCCDEAGLGKVRITFLPGNNALVEVATEEVAALVAGGALEGRKLSSEVLRYSEYRSRKDAMLAAGTWPLPGYGGGGQRGSGGIPAAADAAGAAAQPARGAKRPRLEPEEPKQQPQQPAPGGVAKQCAIM